jgi:hypothetical protein
MPQQFTESVVEQAALDWLAGLGWQTAFGPEIVDSERGGDFGRVVLEGRLRQALLPTLISGELRVPDAERIVGRAL